MNKQTIGSDCDDIRISGIPLAKFTEAGLNGLFDEHSSARDNMSKLICSLNADMDRETVMLTAIHKEIVSRRT